MGAAAAAGVEAWAGAQAVADPNTKATRLCETARPGRLCPRVS